MLKSKTFTILFIPAIFLLSFLAVRQSFNLALGGDDWGLHYLVWSIFDIYKEASYFNPFTYFCTYCPHYFFLSIISRVWGYEPFYYFLASYLARVIVAFSLFFLVKKIGKRTLPAALAAIFFAVTYLGIEATDWAFNYNHILGIAIYAFFLVSYFKTKEVPKFKNYFLSGSLFALALITTPPRMHGMLALVLLVEAGWFFIEGFRPNLKQVAARILMIFALNYIVLYGVSDLYIFFRDTFNFEIGPFFIGNGYGSREWNLQRVIEGINFIKTKISQGQSDLIIDPVATVGNYVLPDLFYSKIPFNKISILGKNPFTFFTFILPIFIVWTALSYPIIKIAQNKIQKLFKNKQLIFYIITVFIWTAFIYYLKKININTFTNQRVAFALIGGYTTILTIWLFVLLKKQKPLFAHLILISFGWMFTFILFPWIIGPFGIINTWGRYSVQQGAGLAIWMAVIITLLIDWLKINKKGFLLGVTYLIAGSFIFLHISLTNEYLGYINSFREKSLNDGYWKQFTADFPIMDKDGLNIFFMITDPVSANVAEALRFGFNARAALYYDIQNRDYTPFMVVNEYEGILSSVNDGKYLIQQGHKPIPTTIDHVYSYALSNKQMLNITNQVREKLKNDLETLRQVNPLPQP